MEDEDAYSKTFGSILNTLQFNHQQQLLAQQKFFEAQMLQLQRKLDSEEPLSSLMIPKDVQEEKKAGDAGNYQAGVSGSYSSLLHSRPESPATVNLTQREEKLVAALEELEEKYTLAETGLRELLADQAKGQRILEGLLGEHEELKMSYDHLSNNYHQLFDLHQALLTETKELSKLPDREPELKEKIEVLQAEKNELEKKIQTLEKANKNLQQDLNALTYDFQRKRDRDTALNTTERKQWVKPDPDSALSSLPSSSSSAPYLSHGLPKLTTPSYLSSDLPPTSSTISSSSYPLPGSFRDPHGHVRVEDVRKWRDASQPESMRAPSLFDPSLLNTRTKESSNHSRERPSFKPDVLFDDAIYLSDDQDKRSPSLPSYIPYSNTSSIPPSLPLQPPSRHPKDGGPSHTTPSPTSAPRASIRKMYVNDEADFNKFTGEPYRKETQEDENKRHKLSPQTRMAWN